MATLRLIYKEITYRKLNFLLGLLAVGDVLGDSRDPIDLSAVIPDREPSIPDPAY